MKASQLTLAVLLTAAFGSAYAVKVEGGDSSQKQLIQAAESDPLPFGAGAAGIKVSTGKGNGLSNSINLEAGPAQRIRNKYGNAPINGGNQNANVNGTANPRYLQPGDINPIAGCSRKPNSPKCGMKNAPTTPRCSAYAKWPTPSYRLHRNSAA